MGWGILITAALAFLGVGVQAPTPEWGSMIAVGARDITTGQWWTAVFPGVVLALAVAGFNLISEGIEAARDGEDE
jgi:peptide/nickel transport system permease protein